MKYTITWQSGESGSEECKNAARDSLREAIEEFASFSVSGAGCGRCKVRSSTGTLRLRAPDGTLLAERGPQ